jgi:hypothetical protein
MTTQALGDLARALERRIAAAANRPSADGLHDFLPPLRALGEGVEAGYDGAAERGFPACRHWPGLLDDAGEPVADLARPLRILGERFRWHQTDGYRRRPPDPDFLDNYCYAVIAGPPHGVPSIWRYDPLELGVLLLGPNTCYPPHHHPALEIYMPLHGARWLRGDEGWRDEPPGAVIHHRSHESHATRTGSAPLLALYLWRGEIAIPARFTT